MTMSPKFSKLLRRVSKILKFALLSQVRVMQILKFHKRAISALILVASFARSKISSQFLGVNGILKFTKQQISLLKIQTLNLKTLLSKRETRGLEFCFAGSQLQGRHEVRPLIHLYIPRLLAVTRQSPSKNPSHVQRACNGAFALHTVSNSSEFLKFTLRYKFALHSVKIFTLLNI